MKEKEAGRHAEAGSLKNKLKRQTDTKPGVHEINFVVIHRKCECKRDSENLQKSKRKFSFPFSFDRRSLSRRENFCSPFYFVFAEITANRKTTNFLCRLMSTYIRLSVCFFAKQLRPLPTGIFPSFNVFFDFDSTQKLCFSFVRLM